MTQSIYMTEQQINGLRNLTDTFEAIKSVRREFEAATDQASKKEIMGRLLSLYASIQAAEIGAVAYVAAFTKKGA